MTGCKALQISLGTEIQYLAGMAADDCHRVFETVIASIKKSLSSDTKDSASVDRIEAGSDLMDVLNQLVATQSRDQWLRFALQPGTSSNNHQSSKARGLHRGL